VFDVKTIRDNPAWFDGGMARRGLSVSSQAIIDLDDQRRVLVTELQALQGRRNAASKEIGKAKGQRDEALAAKLMGEVGALKDQIADGEKEQRRIDAEIQKYLEVIPNVPLDEVPTGADEKGNVEVRKVGTPPSFAFKPKEHFELGEALGLMDFETAQKVSGARFVFLKGGLARMERALAQFMLDIHTEEFGYTEVAPPLLVRDAAVYGTGSLPKFEEDLFKTTRRISVFDLELEQAAAVDDHLAAVDAVTAADAPPVTIEVLRQLHEQFDAFWEATREKRLQHLRDKLTDKLFLVPTAEVPLTNIPREKIVDEATLPMRFTAHTPCFRSEAGAAGRDTRGMIRQHQFSKVELVSITTPAQALAEHERMTKAAETVLQRLGLAYRTMLLCTGDMGFASQKTYDLEVWLPGQNAYREISSCSVCGDFQARRMEARFRPTGGGKPEYVHTLNGSGLAVGRTLIAVMENYQQADGSIVIPEALRPYMGGKTKIG
jgi:seryl-tRNA synthetase